RTNRRRCPCTRAVRPRRSSQRSFISRTLDRSAQRIVASNYSRSSLPICGERFSRATFGKRKNLSLQNLVSPCSTSIRISSDLAHRTSNRLHNSEVGGQSFRRHS